MYTFENLNQALIGLSREILKEGQWRETRGFRCCEFPTPVTIEILNPVDNMITIPERKWAKTLPFAESLWLATGTNHMELVEDYAPNISNFSDDGKFMRAGYGPRIRAFSGVSEDYSNDKPDEIRKIKSVANVTMVDQLKFVVETLKKDISSRQALITIHDPVKDDFDVKGNLKITKDQPCCRILQFMVVNGRLNCTLYIRSNDLLWGLSAVNVFNFTWMQQYIAQMVGVPVGRYYHIANNLHFYEDKKELIETFEGLSEADYSTNYESLQEDWQYEDRFTLEEFDAELDRLFFYHNYVKENKSGSFQSKYAMLNDWGKVFKKYWTKESVVFSNPFINKLYGI